MTERIKIEFEAAWFAECSACGKCVGAGATMASAERVEEYTTLCCSASAVLRVS